MDNKFQDKSDLFFYKTGDSYDIFSNVTDVGFTITLNGKTYHPRSSEAVFQGCKGLTTDTKNAEALINNQDTPGFWLNQQGKELKAQEENDDLLYDNLIPDQEDYYIKEWVMYEILQIKFSQNKELLKALLETGDRNIIENTFKQKKYNDKFWGDGWDQNGRNALGKILMQLRKQFQRELDKNKNGIRVRSGFSNELAKTLGHTSHVSNSQFNGEFITQEDLDNSASFITVQAYKDYLKKHSTTNKRINLKDVDNNPLNSIVETLENSRKGKNDFFISRKINDKDIKETENFLRVEVSVDPNSNEDIVEVQAIEYVYKEQTKQLEIQLDDENPSPNTYAMLAKSIAAILKKTPNTKIEIEDEVNLERDKDGTAKDPLIKALQQAGIDLKKNVTFLHPKNKNTTSFSDVEESENNTENTKNFSDKDFEDDIDEDIEEKEEEEEEDLEKFADRCMTTTGNITKDVTIENFEQFEPEIKRVNENILNITIMSNYQDFNISLEYDEKTNKTYVSVDPQFSQYTDKEVVQALGLIAHGKKIIVNVEKTGGELKYHSGIFEDTNGKQYATDNFIDQLIEMGIVAKNIQIESPNLMGKHLDSVSESIERLESESNTKNKSKHEQCLTTAGSGNNCLLHSIFGKKPSWNNRKSAPTVKTDDAEAIRKSMLTIALGICGNLEKLSLIDHNLLQAIRPVPLGTDKWERTFKNTQRNNMEQWENECLDNKRALNELIEKTTDLQELLAQLMSQGKKDKKLLPTTDQLATRYYLANSKELAEKKYKALREALRKPMTLSDHPAYLEAYWKAAMGTNNQLYAPYLACNISSLMTNHTVKIEFKGGGHISGTPSTKETREKVLKTLFPDKNDRENLEKEWEQFSRFMPEKKQAIIVRHNGGNHYEAVIQDPNRDKDIKHSSKFLSNSSDNDNNSDNENSDDSDDENKINLNFQN